ncbi:MAG: ABC transporter substrate-binding protein [Methylococcaceae bacterium]
MSASAGSAMPMPELDQVTLQLKWTHAFQFAGYYAAKEQGYYREAGLDVRIEEGSATIDPADTVTKGKADFGIGTSSLLLRRNAGQPIVVLAVIFQHSPYVLLARQDSSTQTLQNIMGKRLMLESQADELLIYLSKEGIPLDQIKQMEHSANPQDLIKGKVDVMSGYVTNEPYFLNLAHFPYQIFTPRSAGIDFYGDTLFTTEKQILDHPQRVKAFRDASLKGWRYAMAHPQEIAELIFAKYSQQHPLAAYLFEAQQMIPLIQPEFIEIGYINPGRWQYIADIYIEMGKLPKDFSLKGFLYEAQPSVDLTHLYKILAVLFTILLLVSTLALTIYNNNRKLRNLDKQNRIIAANLRQAKAIAEQSLADQHEFIAMVSHEFRSPLAVIDLSVQLLTLKIAGDADTAVIIGRIRHGITRLSSFLDNCLTEDRLNSHGLTLQISPINLQQLATVIQEDTAQLISPGHQIIIETDPDLPILFADRQLLNILLINLLDNAIKYSSTGSEVRLRILCNDATCLFEIIDQGRGIHLNEQILIFNKYSRGQGVQHIAGAGIGLSLVKNIVEMHSGSINVNSRVNVGTCFTVTFPLNLTPLLAHTL